MYIADLHIHSRYSRATSKDGMPEYLDLWARRKGISIVGTGDFTHPAWRAELREKLVPAEDGLYVLKDEYRIQDGTEGSFAPRFVVTGEISSIYKKKEKVRKVHSLILLPGLDEAEILSEKLETIGNIHSDGRPILGLDCHDLLEITLELCPGAVYVPAHIWTPHFSLFGAFSGFDTVLECFEDLTPHIHAMETGLSSDPPMNWRLSGLDKYQLISNSDAHSPAKLGREANLLNIELSYGGLARAIETGNGLEGTIEFFPEEGKYHYDGHRKCHLCLSPLEAERYSGKCPVCGKKLTIGVSHRVEQLADREEGFILPGAKPFESLVPLPEVIAASTGHSAASIKTEQQYFSMIRKLGSEFSILREVPIEEIRGSFGQMISEGIKRLREGRVERLPGYDGEYGTIRLFNRLEMDSMEGQMNLFSGLGMDNEMVEDSASRREREAMKEAAAALMVDKTLVSETARPLNADMNAAPSPQSLNLKQEAAVSVVARSVAVVAGPGTGKTKTLVSHAIHLLLERKVKPTEMTAVTFTNQAAKEMRQRLKAGMPESRSPGRMRIGTFHSICHDLLKKEGKQFMLADDVVTREAAETVIREYSLDMTASRCLTGISRLKSGLEPDCGENKLPEEAVAAYNEILKRYHMLDFDDLLLETLKMLEEEPANKKLRQGFAYLLADEFQDISPIQYKLLREWNRGGSELFVIGDPDQAIYSFRGADAACFERLIQDLPDTKMIRLEQNYRSTPEILSAAVHVISGNGGDHTLIPMMEKGGPVRIVDASRHVDEMASSGKDGEMSEDIFIAKEINRLIGGIDMLDAHGRFGLHEGRQQRSFGDIAVLYRTHRQAALLEYCLQKEGIPYIVTGRDEFLNERTVRGSISFFNWLVKPEDEAARRICLKLLWNVSEDGRPHKKSMENFEAMREQYLSKMKREKPESVVNSFMEAMGLVEDEPMKKLVSMAMFYKTMPEFLEGLTFGKESDLKRCGGKHYISDAVTLMTLHGSKGLEFPVVLICGVRKGMIPLERETMKIDEAEERRLFYVGMTRAREELVLVTSGEPSVYLNDIPEEAARHEEGEKKKDVQGRQMSLFDFM